MISRAGLAALAVAATAASTQASPITPDMWVYELSGSTSVGGNGLSIYVDMDLPAGSDVPLGCSVRGTLASGDLHVECDLTGGPVFFAGEAFELDVFKDNGWMSSAWNATIAFNETHVVCRGWIECPEGLSTVERDYATGWLSYDTYAYSDDAEWSVALSPTGGRASGSEFGIGFGGSWEYGDYWNSRWFGAEISMYGSAVLVQAPSVPLPAGAWMLLTALGLVVGLSRRRRARLNRTVEGRVTPV